MAIKKKIKNDDGVVTEYHRIAMIKMDVNEQNTLLIHSYLSADGRQVEKDYASGGHEEFEKGLMKWPYVNARYIHCDYDGEMTIEKAYSWLKTQEEFYGAEDV